jgi:hypothetical protein
MVPHLKTSDFSLTEVGRVPILDAVFEEQINTNAGVRFGPTLNFGIRIILSI